MKLSLTKRSDYGLRIVQYLAAQRPGYKGTSAEFAEGCDIPSGNVPTIVSHLSRAEILQCTPGPRGGCVLARPPEEISILEVIEVQQETCLAKIVNVVKKLEIGQRVEAN